MASWVGGSAVPFAVPLAGMEVEKRHAATDVALVNSFGFGGHNAALVITRI
jgi:3-oxoacyl-(acyl-carrier-protein) synthase